MKKKLLFAAAVVAFAVLAVWFFAKPTPVSDPPLPIPNGYDDFLKAGQLVDRNSPDWQAMKGDEQLEALRKIASTNQAALALVRTGLTKQCRMPPWEMNATNAAHLDDLANQKAIAQAFSASAKLALIEGRTNEAATFAMDCIHYGNEVARGGVFIDFLVSMAIKNIGLNSLKQALAGMDSENAGKAIRQLELIRTSSEPFDEVMKRERQWSWQGRFGPSSFFAQIIQSLRDRKSLTRARQKMAQNETDLLRVQLRLASRAYELDHGKPPASSHDLVPQYLKSVPLDPVGKELPLN